MKNECNYSALVLRTPWESKVREQMLNSYK